MITPRTLQGFNDFLPDEMIKRQFLIDHWRNIFIKYGYGQLETPVIEHADILLGKYGEEEKLIYHFKDHGDRHVALRYDQTVPMARVIAEHYDKIRLPFKRYEINRVWRADAARKGRKREFYQCDIDILGASSLQAEAEIITVLNEGFSTLNLPETIITISHRKILEGFMKNIEIPKNKEIEVMRSIDKLDKVGLNGVEDELKSRAISEKAIPKILEFISIKNHDNFIKSLEKLVSDTDEGKQGVEDLKQLMNYLELYEIPQEKYQFSTSLVRGLDYYTGVVMEVLIPEYGTFAVAGGGRYDNLCGMFSKHDVSGVGVAVGFEPLYGLMLEKNLFPENIRSCDVLVTVFDESTLPASLNTAKKLREKGIKTTTYLEPDKLKKQFQYADKLNIPYVIIIGPDEVEKGIVVMKDMKTGEQVKGEVEEITLLVPRY